FGEGRHGTSFYLHHAPSANGPSLPAAAAPAAGQEASRLVLSSKSQLHAKRNGAEGRSPRVGGDRSGQRAGGISGTGTRWGGLARDPGCPLQHRGILSKGPACRAGYASLWYLG